MPNSNPSSNSTQIASKTIKWQDIFRDVDSVASAEYRALSELCADVSDIPNIGGEVDEDRPLTVQQIQHLSGCMDEVIDYANDIKTKIATALKKHST